MKILLFFLFAIIGYAQPYNLGVKYDIVNPGGACTARSTLVANYTTGHIWICFAGTYTDFGGGGGGGGTVTSVSGSGPSWLTWTIATPTTTPAITLAPTTGQTSHQVIGTCGSATTFAPCSLVAGDLPSLPYVPTTRNINTTSPITGGGDLSADRTIACATCVTSAASLTSNLPVFGAGSQAAAVGTRSGNTTEVATVTGSLTSGNCVQSDANHNLVDSGGACGTGGGSNVGCPASNINASGLICLETHTAAALSTELDFTTCLTNTQFDEFEIHLIGLAPASAQILIQFSSNGGSTYDTGANYSWGAFGTTGISGSGVTGLALWNSAISVTSGAAGYNGEIKIFNPASAALRRAVVGLWSIDINTAGLFTMIYGGAWNNTSTAANAFRFFVTSGTFAGLIRCYGIQH